MLRVWRPRGDSAVRGTRPATEVSPDRGANPMCRGHTGMDYTM